MAKATKEKTKPIKVETPYPKEVKAKQQKSDNDYWGEKIVKLQDRVNELELTINDMHNKLKVVTGRMGL